MSRDLWINDEVREWRTGPRTRHPAVARLVGETVQVARRLRCAEAPDVANRVTHARCQGVSTARR